jgi:hypothetical protein
MARKVAVRGLARLASLIFFVWGGLMTGKALWDCFGGQPEANYFSPRPWQFVTREQWFRYAGFELAYGLSCLALAWAILVYAKRLPVWVERNTSKEEFL